MGDDDKSWREIDRQRDGSDHVTRDDGESPSRGDSRSESKYKKKLDRLFESGGEVPEQFQDVMSDVGPEEGTEEAERQEAIEDLREADGFREFAKAVNIYTSKGHRLPDDENLLVRMLDHPDNGIVRQVLEHYIDLSERRDLKRVQPLESRLSTIRTMTDDSAFHELAEQLESIIEEQKNSL
jgi:hypothetical protein